MDMVTSRTFYDFKYVSDPKISPDGKAVAFLVKQVNADDNAYDSFLYIYKNGEAKPATNCNNITDFLWDDEGGLIFSDAGSAKKGKTVYYRIRPEDCAVEKFFVVPIASTKLTFVEHGLYLVKGTYENAVCDAASKIGTVTTLTEVPYWGEFGAGFNCGQRQRLFLYSCASGECTPVTEPEFQTIRYDVHDGIIAVVGMKYSDIATQQNGLYAYNIKEQRLRELVPQGQMYITSATVFGRTILFTGSQSTPWQYNREHNDFFTIPVAGGKVHCILEYDHNVFGGNGTTDAKMGGGQAQKRVKDRLYLLSTRIDDISMYSIDLSGDWREEIRQTGFITGFDIVADRLVYSGMFGNRLNELYENGKQITHLNDEVTENLTLSTPMYCPVKTSDGFEIHGWVMKPVDYIPGKKYPAIFHIHGGPPTIFSNVFHCEHQLWANHGYFVFFCNHRGSDGRGTAFRNLTGKHGQWDYVSLMDWLDGALEEYPDVDQSRVGVTGGSYGGYMTNWIITQTNRFAAAVSQRSISDWITFEYTAIRGWWLSVHKFGTRAGLDAKPLWDASPLQFTENCKTPTLFIQSDNDHVTPLGQALAMFSALKTAGCEAKMCIFHGEDHELSRAGKPENRIRRMNEILEWFDLHLKTQCS